MGEQMGSRAREVSDSQVSKGTTSMGGIPRRLTLLLGALLLSGAMLMVAASTSSALSTGLMWSGDIEQTVSSPEWEVIHHSGSTIYRVAILRDKWNKGASTQIYDQLFERAALANVTILPNLGDRQSGGPGFPVAGEPEYEDWYLWAKEVVKRYGYNGNFWSGKPFYKPVTAWEVWNEPNLAIENSGGTVQPENYGDFLIYIANAIRTAQTEQSGGGTQVLMGGLYLGVNEEEGNMSYEKFLNEVYKVPGLYSCYDGLSIHPYSFDNEHKTELSGFESKIENVRALLNSKPWGPSRSLWITEMGWPVGGTGAPPVTESKQAELLTNSFNWVKSVASEMNIQSLIWYNVRDVEDSAHTSWDYRDGLLKATWEARPSWSAFQAETGAESWTPSPPPATVVKGVDDEFPGPHAVVQSNGTIDVFYRTPWGELGHDWYGTGGTWASGNLPGSVASDPHAVVQSNGTIDVFYRTPSGELGHDWYDTGGSGWHSGTLAGSVASDPYPYLQSNGTIDVFYRTPSGELGHDWVGSGGGSWASGTLAGSVAGDPHAVVQSNGTIDVFYRTPSGELGHDWYGTGGGGWASGNLAGSVAGDPFPLLQSNGTIDVFYRTPAGELGHDWYGTGGGGWASGALGGTVGSGSVPHGVVQSNGTIDAFYRTPSGELGHDWYGTGGGGWASGALAGWVAAPGTFELATPAIATVTTGGEAFLKTGSLTESWVAESVSGVKILKASVAAASGISPALAVYGENHHLYLKEGLSGSWLDEGGGVESMSVATDATHGPVFGALDTNEHVYAKQGLYGSWVDEGPDAKSISVASDATHGPLIGALGTNGHLYVKQGIYGSWVDEGGNVTAISVASDATHGPLIGALATNGHLYVKQGIYGSWVDELGSVTAISVASDATNGPLIGVLGIDGHVYVKQGSLYGSWVDELGSVTAFGLASDATNGPLIGVLGIDGHVYVKQGSLYGSWVDELGEASGFAVGG